MNATHIIIRPYNETDAPALAAIFFNTIHIINSKDYSPTQIDAWAPESRLKTESWIGKWKKLPPIVATIDDVIVGFAELEENGHIDCFYCHHEYQNRGVGSALMKEIEERAKKNKLERLFAEVSITAKAFFAAKGFTIEKQQLVNVRGVELTNFVMQKILID